ETTINANRYCETLKKTTASHPKQEARNDFWRNCASSGQCPALTLLLLLKNCWINSDRVIFDHPPYSPDLAPSDFHLFLKLKEFLNGKRYGSDKELENAATTWVNELAAEEYDMGILKLV
ncbi:hypothetical protein AVEN_102115-1, partial [Araneus ventricosus]